MPTISNLPRGLISLLGLQDMGASPRELSGVVAGTLDLAQFLLLNRETLSASPVAAAVGTQVVFTVPPGELWYVHAFGARVGPVGAGLTLRIGAGIATNQVYTPITSGETAVGGELANAGLLSGLWATPGQALCIEVQAIGAPSNINSSAVITRLRI